MSVYYLSTYHVPHSVSDDGGKLETSSNTAYGVVTASQEPEYEVIELQRDLLRL